MAKGIIYVCSTVVSGLIKIGRTDNFERRMSQLERDGYRNVTGLKREFAIEVDDYEDKETLLDDLFARSRVGNTELFSLDLNKTIQLLTAFEGVVIYPTATNKEEAFEQFTEIVMVSNGAIPDGSYHLNKKVKSVDAPINADMEVKGTDFILKSGSQIAPLGEISVPGWIVARNSANIQNGVLMGDVVCSSPSMAAAIVVGHNTNGWKAWKNSNGEFIDIYRKTNVDGEDE